MTADTAPDVESPPRPQTALELLAAAQATELLLAEIQASQLVSWPLRAALAAIGRQARSRWLVASYFGTPATSAGLRVELAAQLRQAAAQHLGPDTAVPVLLEAARTAGTQGTANAAAQAAVQRPAEQLLAPAVQKTAAIPHVAKPTPLIDAVARAARDTAHAHIERSVRLLAGAQGPADLEHVLAAAERAPDALALAAEWLVNRAANQAVRAAAIRAGAKLLWIAERDACVVCSALSGQVADVLHGEGFDEFATFGSARPLEPWPRGRPLMAPPRHPHCRCQTVLWLGTLPGQPDLPAALIREAKRSILRGFSRPSEPHRTRIVAAERLLQHGAADMPKSVRAYAARAVEHGRFPTRDVPRYVAQPRRKANA